eukprot:758974-Hanusia_phi.AAC.8
MSFAASLCSCLIPQAYDVLSDANKRKVYDQFGEEGLKGNAPGGAGGMPGGFRYEFHGDPNEIFRNFFGSSGFGTTIFSSCRALIMLRIFWRLRRFRRHVLGRYGRSISVRDGRDGRNGWHGRNGRNGRDGRDGRRNEYENPFCHGFEGDNALMWSVVEVLTIIKLSLEELFSGVTKKMKITRKSVSPGRSTEYTFEIQVKPGWKAGTKLTYAGEGDEYAPGQEKPHDRFQRSGSDLIYKVRGVKLVDALTGFTVSDES